MKTLHILKTGPDELTTSLISVLGNPQPTEHTVIRLNDSTDYEALIEAIFAHDKVITWW
jgi:hypothetical protein